MTNSNPMRRSAASKSGTFPLEHAALPARTTLGSDYKREKHQRRQREILDAAAATFTEHGFHATTMQHIAERVGTRAGSLYHYIASKEVALESICRATGVETNRRLTEILDGGGPAAEMIRRGIEMHLDPASIDYVNAFAFFRRSLPLDVRTEMSQLARQYLATWEAIVRRGVDEGALRDDLDPRAATAGIVAMCNGVISWLTRKAPDEFAPVSHELAELVVNGLRRPPGRASRPKSAAGSTVSAKGKPRKTTAPARPGGSSKPSKPVKAAGRRSPSGTRT